MVSKSVHINRRRFITLHTLFFFLLKIPQKRDFCRCFFSPVTCFSHTVLTMHGFSAYQVIFHIIFPSLSFLSPSLSSLSLISSRPPKIQTCWGDTIGVAVGLPPVVVRKKYMFPLDPSRPLSQRKGYVHCIIHGICQNSA